MPVGGWGFGRARIGRRRFRRLAGPAVELNAHKDFSWTNRFLPIDGNEAPATCACVSDKVT